MSRFEDFNAENKLRLSLTAYAAGIIANDERAFSKKRTTLINAIILNSYAQAECSISLKLHEYRTELSMQLSQIAKSTAEYIIEELVQQKAVALTKKYAKKYPSDTSWQITLNKRVKDFLTDDPLTCEEIYYGPRPGHYIRALIEEYAKLPFYKREEIIFKEVIDSIAYGIDQHYILNITNINGTHMALKPYKIICDPLSMFHYLVGYRVSSPAHTLHSTEDYFSEPPVIALRISRLTNIDVKYYQLYSLSSFELKQISDALNKKGVQFLGGVETTVKVYLSDNGIKLYNTKLHLRPILIDIDSNNSHIYYFDCTASQAQFYFLNFGVDAIILSPEALRTQFAAHYKEAAAAYDV